MVVVWRFRKDRNVAVVVAIEEEARRMREEDVERAALEVGCERGGMIGIERFRGENVRWHEVSVALVADGWII